MKKFVLLDLQNTDVRDEYEGEFLENSTYCFTSTKNPENSIEVVLIEKDKASFVRHTPEFCLSGTLKKNNVVNLDLVTKGFDFKGSLPVLVREVKVDFPNEILLRYQMLDDKKLERQLPLTIKQEAPADVLNGNLLGLYISSSILR